MRSEWKPTPELYALLAFEKEKQLFSYSYRGVYLWHLVRMSVLSKAIAHGNVNGHPDAKYIRLSPLLPWICRFVEQIGRKKIIMIYSHLLRVRIK